MSEAHAKRTVGDSDSQNHDELQSDTIKPPHGRPCDNGINYAAGGVDDADQDHRGCPRPRANPLSAHGVGHSVEEGTAEEAQGYKERGRDEETPKVW